MNSINITGRLVADVELRKTGAGTDMCRGTIAVKTLTKEGVNYFDFFATGSTANAFVQYTRKGAMVGLSGRLVSSNYEDKNGNKRTAISIAVDDLTLLEKAPEQPKEDAKSDEKKPAKKKSKASK